MAKSEKKLVKSPSGLRMVCVDQRTESPFILPEPQWTSDNECVKCQNCDITFDFLHRKHHCRRCGRCVCKKCSSKEVPLPRMCFVDPVRHCDACHRITLTENEFFDKHLKTLLTGGNFFLHTDMDNGNVPSGGKPFRSFLSSDHKLIQFDGNLVGPENIPLEKIQSVQIDAKVDYQGKRVGKGIALHYTDSQSNKQCFKMQVEEGPKSQQGMSWVVAMQNGFKMLYESRQQDKDWR